ncbi:alpha/beta fold hydrolase [Bacillus toyonensis]|uniref:alpha/beta fold hydrolase n=1 Tax=Bacillus toyonensis TaxID=155322 RepID=UPI00028B87CE|nr:alpha/beta fold hydrolase [Bacillus toyonensis]AFU12495.1 alpha/beta hydrolase fold protein [Bacillus thuringiensis MC28]OTX06523.1 alpha/beta hydrolase [Bacillus thuringiensis serovar seoulensis]MCA1043222.1 alpha/beta fold hydrolase [Bacillus toyonensis]MDO8161597.1 alpha/beta fold hydrolase [Bacillus toyonensis]MED3199713.1 alpha/beta fold hydrolase [Bacillus toyonensis]
MSTYVLVHGAWQGEWAWELVKPQLEALSHTVITLDLPGSGKDTNPSQNITLDSYVDAVTATINQQTEKVIVVGHSMGGIVITQTAELIPNKIDKLVYLCAFLPQNGESLGSKLDGEAGPQFSINENDMTAELIPNLIEKTFLNATENEEIKEASSKKMRPQPLGPFQQQLKISEENFGTVDRIYIETTLDRAIPIDFQRRMNTETPCSKIITLEADHSPFFSKATELVNCLHALS